jgi:hypothetical protein
MSKTTPQPGVQKDSHRDDALEESMKKALKKQPEEFKDVATAEKVVEIGPELTADPIKGIDPVPKPGR